MTPKQQRFVEEYTRGANDGNATQAYIAAGYTGRGAGSSAANLLKNTAVSTAIMEARAARALVVKKALADQEVTVERVLKELAALAFIDMATFLKLGEGETTVRLDWSKLPEGATKCIQEITQEEHTGGRGHDTGQIKRTKFKLYSKLDALEKIGRHLSMFTEKIKIEGSFLDALSPDELVDLVKQLKASGFGKGEAEHTNMPVPVAEPGEESETRH